MITLDKVKIIKEGRKKKVNNPGQGDLFDKGRPAQRQNPSTKKSVDQVKRDIEFQQDLKKAGASGDVSDKAGPEIRKKVETVRKTRADKLGTPDPFDVDTSKASKEVAKDLKAPTTSDIKKGKIPKGFSIDPKSGFDSPTPTGKLKLPPPKVSPEAKKKTFDKFAKQISTASKDTSKFGSNIKNLKRDVKRNKKVEKDIQKVIDKVEKKSSVGKNPYAQGDPLTGFKKGQQIGSSGINQSDVSKKAKEFTNKVNKIRKSKSTILGPDGKPLTKIKGKVGFDPNPDYLRKLQAGGSADIGLDSNPMGGGASGSTAGGTGSTSKPKGLVDKFGKPLIKTSKSEPVRKVRIPRKQADDLISRVRKDTTRKNYIEFNKKIKDLEGKVDARSKDYINQATRTGYAKGTKDTLDAARRAGSGTGGTGGGRTGGTGGGRTGGAGGGGRRKGGGASGSGFGNNKFGGRRYNSSYYYNPKYNARTGKDAMDLLRRIRAKRTPTAGKILKNVGKYALGTTGKGRLVRAALGTAAYFGGRAYLNRRDDLTKDDIGTTSVIKNKSGKGIDFKYPTYSDTNKGKNKNKEDTGFKNPDGTYNPAIFRNKKGFLSGDKAPRQTAFQNKFKTGEFKVDGAPKNKDGTAFTLNKNLAGSAFEKQLQQAEKGTGRGYNPFGKNFLKKYRTRKDRQFLSKYKDATRPTKTT